VKHLPSDSVALISFPKRPEYTNNSFTLTFSKIKDLTDTTPDVVLSGAQDILLLADCSPVVKFAVDGNSLSEGAWVLTLFYEGLLYDGKMIYVDSGEPKSSPAGQGILESVTILDGSVIVDPSEPLPTTRYLDAYAGDFGHYYGLQKRFSPHSGSVIRVRRSSDGQETDIGWNGDVVDSSAILAFAGNDTVTVARVEDQLGGTPVIQGDLASQPIIADAGAIKVGLYGEPVMVFSGSKGILKGGNDTSSFTAPFPTMMVAWASQDLTGEPESDKNSISQLLFGSGGARQYLALVEDGIITNDGYLVKGSSALGGDAEFIGVSTEGLAPTAANSSVSLGTEDDIDIEWGPNYPSFVAGTDSYLISIGGGNNYPERAYTGEIGEVGFAQSSDKDALKEIRKIIRYSIAGAI